MGAFTEQLQAAEFKAAMPELLGRAPFLNIEMGRGNAIGRFVEYPLHLFEGKTMLGAGQLFYRGSDARNRASLIPNLAHGGDYFERYVYLKRRHDTSSSVLAIACAATRTLVVPAFERVSVFDAAFTDQQHLRRAQQGEVADELNSALALAPAFPTYEQVAA